MRRKLPTIFDLRGIAPNLTGKLSSEEYLRKIRRRRPREIEAQEQAEVVRWLIDKGIFFTASANGARTSMIQAVKLKRLGCRAGTPDLMIFEPRGTWHGLFIEMKRPKIAGVCDRGRASTEQIEFAKEATDKGYRFIFCYGAEEAKREILSYLEEGK